MKQFYRFTLFVILMFLIAPNTKGQGFPQANPSVLDINMQGPTDPDPIGSNISGTAILKFEVENSSSSSTPSNSQIPIGAVEYTLTFNDNFTYESMLQSSEFEVVFASPGSPLFTVKIRNKIVINPQVGLAFYIKVKATKATTTANGAKVTMNVVRTLPIQCGNGDGDDNVEKNFGVVSLIVTPIKNIDLTAVLNNQRTDLKWVTTDEFNVNRLELERSIDGHNFSTIASKQAAGNTTGKTTYTHADDVHAITSPVIYYRVKGIDNDSKFYYSKIVTVTQDKAEATMAWPNPFLGQVNIRMKASAKGKASVNLYSTIGQLVKKMETSVSAGINFLTIDGLEQLPKQTYLVQVINDNKIAFTGKFSKQ